MGVYIDRVTVGTSATRLDTGTGGAWAGTISQLARRGELAERAGEFVGSTVLIVAQGSGTLITGPSGVTAATGTRIPVVAGTTIRVDLNYGDSGYWAVVASGTLDCDVQQIGT